MALVIEDPSGNPYFLVTAVSSKKIITINNTHEKITRFWLAESSAVQV